MVSDTKLRALLHGRNLSLLARDTGISYDALYRFVGKPLSLFDRVILCDYLLSSHEDRLDASGEMGGNEDRMSGQK